MIKKLQSTIIKRSVWILILCLFGFTGAGLVLYSTVWGSALFDDSYYYISSARNLLAGRGFDLTPSYPPFLSLVLSAIGLIRIDPLTGIRWLNALLFGVNIFLIAWIVRLMTRSSAFSLLAGLLALVMSTMIVVHSAAMSEGLYISLSSAGFLMIALGFSGGKPGGPILTGLCFGLAAATRYIGVSLLLAGGIFWLVEAGKTSRARLRNAFWFSLVGVVPSLLWAVRNEILIGRPTNRVFSWHPMPKSLWINALNTMFLWLAPGRLVNGKELLWLAGFGLLLLAWLGITLYRDRRALLRLGQSLYHNKPALLIGLSALTYWVVLVVSRTFFDDRIPVDERLLSPFLAMGLILLVAGLAKLWEYSRWLGRGAIVMVSVVLILVNSARSTQTVQSYHVLGRGYAAARNHISETYAYLRNRPNTQVYSNAYAGIYFWVGRVTNPLPPPEGLPAMKDDMRQNGALLVIFDSIPVSLYGDTEEQLTEGLVTQIRLSEATIYRSP